MFLTPKAEGVTAGATPAGPQTAAAAPPADVDRSTGTGSPTPDRHRHAMKNLNADFLLDIWADLKAKRLAPVAIGLVVAAGRDARAAC